MDTDAPKETGTMLTPATPRRRVGGFTLIELLTVIAIIAILAAIIFPVFFTAKEKARQATVMDNFRQINTALAKYKLDHHQYPNVLFGYVVTDASGNAVPMSGALGAARSAPGGSQELAHFPGLYPQYINDASVFTDPNNMAKPADTQAVDVNVLCPNVDTGCTGKAAGTLAVASPKRAFYTADAYDIGPTIAANANGLTSPLSYIARYQRAWTSFPPPTALTAFAQRQLAFPNPDGNTYVTCSTYHVPQGKVLVLFQDGTARTMDTSRFLNGMADPATIDAAPATPAPTTASQAQFWQVTP